MSGRSRWLVRLVRLLAVCIAVLVARPAAATPAVDRIVLVAETLTSSRADDAPTTPRPAREAGTVTSAAERIEPSAAPQVRPHRATRALLVLVPDKYLRNCSLLR